MEFLFLDLDDTILDFHKAEKIALSGTLRKFAIEPTPEVLDLYHRINIEHWQRLERGELTREQVLTGRFRQLFRELGMEADPVSVAQVYEGLLAQGHYFLPGAEEAVKLLSSRYKLYLASNGTARVQHSRLTSAGLYPYFHNVFVSQEIGYPKPSKEYFDRCFRRIPGFRKDRAMIIGDSLTSDILGGIQAGIATCWVSTKELTGAIRPDYIIPALRDLPALLEREF